MSSPFPLSGAGADQHLYIWCPALTELLDLLVGLLGLTSVPLQPFRNGGKNDRSEKGVTDERQNV